MKTVPHIDSEEHVLDKLPSLKLDYGKINTNFMKS
jgi:hypothetical protein